MTFATSSFTLVGAYLGTITVTGTGVSVSIPVEVNVAAAPVAVTPAPASLTVNLDHRDFRSGGANHSIEHCIGSGGFAHRQGQPILDRAFGDQFQREPIEAGQLVDNLRQLRSFTAAGSLQRQQSPLTGTGVSVSIPVQVNVAAAATVVTGGQSTLIPLIEDGSGVATSFTLLNPYPSPTVASLSFFSAAGAPVSIATGTAAAASWQNLTIPAYGAATIATTGSSSPQKQGFAIVQTGDATKRVPAMAQVGLGFGLAVRLP